MKEEDGLHNWRKAINPVESDIAGATAELVDVQILQREGGGADGASHGLPTSPSAAPSAAAAAATDAPNDPCRHHGGARVPRLRAAAAAQCRFGPIDTIVNPFVLV